MPIQLGDVKLVASAVMDDVPEGGGAPSAHVVADGVSNEIFKDISESDRARGRLNMSKVFVSVQTPDVDTYLGANFIVATPPEDPNVSVTVFTTGEVYDTRTQAQSRMEAYLNKGAEWPGFLYENHIAGQGTIQIFQRPNSEIPAVGKTLVLTLNEGLSTVIEQYVRVTRVSVVERTFTYNVDQDYKAWIVSLELSDVLRNDMAGTSANRSFTRSTTGARVRDTLVADAGSYAGVTPLAQAVTVGDFSIRAESVYSPLVPSAQVETPIAASAPYGALSVPSPGKSTLTYTSSAAWTTTTDFTLPGGCAPNTLAIVTGGVTINDKGGTLVVGTTQVGTIDYANGILKLSTGTYSASKSITYKPSAFALQLPQSYDVQITAENRSLSFVGFLSPLAAAGTLSVSYQVQSRWYVLTDAGDGTLRGYDQSYGVGQYNKDTGDFLLTLGALPDVGSALIFQWGIPTQDYAFPAADLKLTQNIALDPGVAQTLDPAYLKVTWTDGTAKSATGNAAGNLTGDATGKIDTAQSILKFSPNAMPPVGTQLTIEFDHGAKTEVNFAHPSRDGQGKIPVNAGATNLTPGSVVVEWNTLTDLTPFGTYTRAQLLAMGIGLSVDPTQYARDDGAGNLVLNGANIGTVTYSTGAILFNPDVIIQVPTVNYSTQRVVSDIPVGPGDVVDNTALWRVNYNGLNYVTTASLYPPDTSGYVKVSFYAATGATRTTRTVTFEPQLELITGVRAQVVPGSVALTTSSGLVWADNSAGVIREYSGTAWVTRGSIDYVTGIATITSWTASPTITTTVRRVTTNTTDGAALSSAFVFRTAAAPIRPGSLSIQYGASGGGTAVVSAGTDGVISGAGAIGTVDFESGVVRVGFGTFVTAAGNEGEPWYDSTRVLTNGQIFKPNPVVASTLKYTAVAYSYMPLNADLIGVDPVRLPSDGRVPIFRTGSMVVIGNTKVSAPMTPTNGQVVNLGRTRLSRAVVRDSAGLSVMTNYSVDLEAGTLTFGDVSTMAKPVTIEDRIEDMLVARDVQISGEMSFTRQVSHSYPVAGTYVSSALEFGDRKARVSVTFDQATWDGVTWSDSATSAVAPATYNTVLSPIVVTNAGASTERWAIWFTSATAFRLLGEHVGQIATGDINSVLAPVNPATGQPYFTMNPIGWGTGWAVGNVVRLNTIGSLCPVWVVRTTQPSVEAGLRYSFDLLTRGDVDRP